MFKHEVLEYNRIKPYHNKQFTTFKGFSHAPFYIHVHEFGYEMPATGSVVLGTLEVSKCAKRVQSCGRQIFQKGNG